MKPARYTGIEPNNVIKNPSAVKVRFALCYPDIYEVGMSYFGLFLLYELMNSREGVWCERCFAPWHDMDAYLRQNGIPLATLESKTPLNMMNAVGFSLSYELNVTNVLNMLSLAGIALRAEERNGGPIVVGGGPLMLNPKPFERYFDIIVIGEGDKVIVDILNILKQSTGEKRERVVRELSLLEGVYSPLFPKERVNRLVIDDLDSSYHPIHPPIPIVGAIHNRLNIEISRGCGNGCRFCLAGFGYRPYRERSYETVKDIIDRAVRETGYEEISLLSLTSGDYSSLFPVISHIKRHHPGVSVALPSLKIGSIGEDEIGIIGDIARTGFTFALESASPSIRDRINKNIDVNALVDLLPTLKKNGWKRLKLYFMIGFPWETDDDILAIRDLVAPFNREGISINLAVSPFIPKPHTPFQWLPMEREERLTEKLFMVKRALKKKNVSVKYRDVRTSMVEAIISRGDERIAPLFEELTAAGAKLEAWREFFRPALYDEWFEKATLDKNRYLGSLPSDAHLPWSFINAGVEEPFLKSEREKAEYGIMTPDCYSGCAACGMNCADNDARRGGHSPGLDKETGTPQKPLSITVSCGPYPEPRAAYQYTFRYGKYGDAKYLGHLDTMNILIRALRSSGIRIRMHGKYHPMPNISLTDALPMGVESTCELIEVESLYPLSEHEILIDAINKSLPRGLKIFECMEGSLRETIGECAFLFISEKPAGGAGLTELKSISRKNRNFYVSTNRKGLKDLWKSGTFRRIVKVEVKKIDGIRADH